MRMMPYVLCACFSLVMLLSLHPSSSTSVSAMCPNIAGKWVKQEDESNKHPVLTINQNRCNISGGFQGKETSFGIDGTWENNPAGFRFVTDLHNYNKTTVNVVGRLGVEHGYIVLTVEDTYPTRNAIPDELKGEVLLVRMH